MERLPLSGHQCIYEVTYETRNPQKPVQRFGIRGICLADLSDQSAAFAHKMEPGAELWTEAPNGIGTHWHLHHAIPARGT